MWTTAATRASQHWPRASAMAATTGQIAASCCAVAVRSPRFTLPKAGICCHCHSVSNSIRSGITPQSRVGAEAWGAMVRWQWGRLPALWHWPVLGYCVVSFNAVENRAFCKTRLCSEQQMPWWKSYCSERMQLWFEDSHNCWRWRLNGLQLWETKQSDRV